MPYNKEYYLKNKDKYAESQKKWRFKNKSKLKVLKERYEQNHPLRHRMIKKLSKINQRCNYLKDSSYKYYGAKGIKNYLTYSGLEFLWNRDKAYLMKHPSIDRKDSNKDYTLENCRFLEWSENSKRNR